MDTAITKRSALPYAREDPQPPANLVVFIPVLLAPAVLLAANPAGARVLFGTIAFLLRLLFRLFGVILKFMFVDIPLCFLPALHQIFDYTVQPALHFVSHIATGARVSLQGYYQSFDDMWGASLFADNEPPARLPSPKKSTPMKSADAKRLGKKIAATHWGKKVDSFIVNRLSHTISVFTSLDQSQSLDLPLIYGGLPIVPHCIEKPAPADPLSVLEKVTNETITTALEPAHVSALFAVFPNSVAADLFLDRFIYLYFDQSDYRYITEKRIHSGCFVAWGATFIIMQVGPRIERRRRALPVSHGAVQDLNPGMDVLNFAGEPSTLGTFLQGAQSESRSTATHITVSAHSFVKRRYLEFDGSLISCVVVSCIVTAVYVLSELCPTLWHTLDSSIWTNYLTIKLMCMVCEAQWTGLWRKLRLGGREV
jgi:hypothetical protein